MLDKPTDALDPDQRLGCRNLLAQLAQDRTIVLSTHQIDDAAALSGTTVVLDRGRVRFAGPTTRLTALAEGRVWVTREPDPTATRSWGPKKAATATSADHPRAASRSPRGCTTRTSCYSVTPP